ncbi:MAG: ATP-binding cassette domain-containing protein [Raineya sp.]
MTEEILKALMQLFGLTASLEGTNPQYRLLVENFLAEHLSLELSQKYLLIFEEYAKLRTVETNEQGQKLTSMRVSSRMLVICTRINQELTQQQKVVVLTRMIELIAADGEVSNTELEFINTVASIFNFHRQELESLLNFVLSDSIDGHFLENTLYISAFEDIHYTYHLLQKNLSGMMLVLRIPSLENYLFKYIGEQDYYLNGLLVKPRSIHFLSPGSVIRGSRLESIYYSDIVGIFRKDKMLQQISFEAEGISYLFAGKKNGVRGVTIRENAGKLFGIMGESGAGKSTLLELLNGSLKPQTGKVLLNGRDVHKEKLEGMIGYVPQDDLLIENLSVYENMYYAAKLSLGEANELQIKEIVDTTLQSLGLQEVKDLRVGSPLERYISGGQRKRLNIGLELIRKPLVLFVDEPTSGLSSRDSENIMDLLKELALEGKLVFVVLHQPSSTVFKMFDKFLILDTGGYPIYYGSPSDMIQYFKKHANQISRYQGECMECGNVNVEQVFDIIAAKIVNEYGRFTEKRKISPQQWHQIFQQEQSPPNIEPIKNHREKNRLQLPNRLKQFYIFFKRDVHNKIKDSQYLLINLLQAPLLAFGLAYVNRYYETEKNGYILGENENLPAYIFIAIIVAIFSGLVGSAEQIIMDRKSLRREQFIHLSRNSYIFAKMLVLFTISAIQTLILVWIGNSILEIRGMFWEYFVVLFSCSAFANVLGLNISDSFKSAITVYILIPLLLIPQLVLGGIVIPFDKVNPEFKWQKDDHIPWLSEFLASRWAFEALIVTQFKDNIYEKPLYAYDKIMATAEYKKIFYLGELEKMLKKAKENPYSAQKYFKIIKKELEKELDIIDKKELPHLYALSDNRNLPGMYVYIDKLLQKIRTYYQINQKIAQKQKDAYLQNNPRHKDLRNLHHNEALAILAKQSQSEKKIVLSNDYIEPIINAVFIDGRDASAHFFAPTKKVFHQSIATFWFNITIIWLMILSLYVALYLRLLSRLVLFVTQAFIRAKTLIS